MSLEREHNLEPALRRLVEVAAGVGHELSTHAGRAVDGRGVVVERVQVHGVTDIREFYRNDVRFLHQF